MWPCARFLASNGQPRRVPMAGKKLSRMLVLELPIAQNRWSYNLHHSDLGHSGQLLRQVTGLGLAHCWATTMRVRLKGFADLP